MARKHLITPQLIESATERFWQSVDKTPGHGPKGECWIWTGATNGTYGMMQLVEGKQNPRIYAHRMAYWVQNGELADSLCACHRCDFRMCVRGSHLFAGTKTENNADRHRKGRTVNPGIPLGMKMRTATRDVVLAMRQRYANGESPAVLAREFNLGYANAIAILTFRSWKHVA